MCLLFLLLCFLLQSHAATSTIQWSELDSLFPEWSQSSTVCTTSVLPTASTSDLTSYRFRSPMKPPTATSTSAQRFRAIEKTVTLTDTLESTSAGSSRLQFSNLTKPASTSSSAASIWKGKRPLKGKKSSLDDVLDSIINFAENKSKKMKRD